MEQNKKILSELENILQSLSEQIGQKKSNGEISPLELEWIKARFTIAFDLVLQLNKAETKVNIKQTPIEKELVQENTLIDTLEKPLEIAVQPTAQVQEPGEVSNEIIQLIETASLNSSARSENLEDTSYAQKNKKENTDTVDPLDLIEKADLKILAEKFKTPSKSLYESMGQQAQPSKGMYDKLQSTTVKSISQGIGINDKFLFVKELFKGDSEAFHKTLNNLDKAESFDEVFNYVKGHFDWDTESENVQRLLGIAKRKFNLDQK